MNMLTNINEIFSMGNIGVLVGIIVPVFILLFFAKYRGIWASLWLLPVLFTALQFASTFPQVSAIIDSNLILAGVCEGFAILMTPFVTVIHTTIEGLLGLIPEVPYLQSFVFAQPWFYLALYAIVWLLFLAIFKRKRRRKKVRRYEDDF